MWGRAISVTLSTKVIQDYFYKLDSAKSFLAWGHNVYQDL